MNRALLFFIVLLFSCQSEWSKLPILSFTFDENGKKEFYAIDDFQLTNQLGKEFTNNDTHGKVYIANFFFTKCPSICPPMRNSLVEIANHFKDEDAFMIVSHTIDPENDTVKVLKEYADNTSIPTNKWIFLTGEKSVIVSVARKYMTSFKKTEDGSDFYHSSFTMLIDKNQKIRGFYNTLIENDMIKLQKDISLLLKEKADL